MGIDFKAQLMLKYFVSVLLTCSSVVVYSQHVQRVNRKGFVFGTSLGLAHSVQKFPGKNQSNTDLGLDVKLGYMIKPNLALLLTSNVSTYNYSGIARDRKRDFGIVAPSLQYWISKRMWVLAGAGLAVDAPVFWDIKNAETDKNETNYYTGGGLIASVGYEFYKRKNLVLDVKTRLTYRNVNLPNGKVTGISPSILVGFNFY